MKIIHAITIIIALFLLLPFIGIIVGLFDGTGNWNLLSHSLIYKYTFNTLILIIGVSFLSVLFAVPTAWFVTYFDFPFKNIIKILLIFPLAVPTYVNAFVYYDFLDLFIPLQIYIKEMWGLNFSIYFDIIIKYFVLTIMFSSVLFPYIYIGLVVLYKKNHMELVNVAKLMGKSSISIFKSISLPLSYPVIFTGLSLITMEVVNDYGAVSLFGFHTLTEGIFRTWFGLGDKSTALIIVFAILALIFFVILIEGFFRKKMVYSAKPHKNSLSSCYNSSLKMKLIIYFFCLLPLFTGFLYPIFKFSSWAYIAFNNFDFSDFHYQFFTTFCISLISSIIIIILGFFLAFIFQIKDRGFICNLVNISTLGYAIPSVVIGVGLMVILGNLDHLQVYLFQNPVVLLSGSLFALSCAYITKFITIPFQSLKSSMLSICRSLSEASLTLNRGRIYSLLFIYIPLLKPYIFLFTLIIFVEILKELPLALILRPTGFESLSTSAFGYFKEGYIYDCAIPSLMIIFCGCIGVLAVNHSLKNSS